MASLTKEPAGAGKPSWRLRVFVDGKRRSMRLGSINKKDADEVLRHVEALARAAEIGTLIPPATESWLLSIDPKLRSKLNKWGLCDPANRNGNADAGRLLGPFVDAYIAGRTDVAKRTTINFQQARRLLVEFFSEDYPIKAITPADADRWRRWLLVRPVARDADGNVTKTMASATISKHVKRAKTIFAFAVRDRLLPESPFADQTGMSEINRTRDHFVSRSVSQAVLNACPDHDWRLIFVLSRFGGMRCPSEVTGLKWSDVLWDVSRLRIDSPKTGLRFCPIFPEVLPILESAFDDAPSGATFCVQRYRSDANLGTQMQRIITAAGCVPWDKTFQNLRSSRRTELQEAWPDHVINAWLGQSSAVAAKHYLQVTDDHWENAANAGAPLESGPSEKNGPISGPLPANSQAFTAKTAQKNPAFPVTNDSKTLGIMPSVPPVGLEPTTR